MPTFGEKSQYDLEGADEKHLQSLKSRLVRWQDKQINLLTFSINLLFTISVAAIGLIINNFDKNVFKNKLLFGYSLPQTTAFILTISAIIGIAALWSRLRDFRLTTKTNRKRELLFKVKNNIRYESKKKLEQTDLEASISCLKCWKNFYGKLTWRLFVLQTAIFIAGTIILICNL